MNNQPITAPQLKCIHAMLNKLNIQDKDALMLGFSGMRTGSSKELTMEEAKKAIEHLKSLDPDEASAEKQRRKLIGLAYKYKGLSARASIPQKQDAVNWLNGWCQEYGYLRKRLNQYNQKQLPKLITQFEKVVADTLSKI